MSTPWYEDEEWNFSDKQKQYYAEVDRLEREAYAAVARYNELAAQEQETFECPLRITDLSHDFDIMTTVFSWTINAIRKANGDVDAVLEDFLHTEGDWVGGVSQAKIGWFFVNLMAEPWGRE